MERQPNDICPVMYILVFLLYEGLYDCSLLISLCTIIIMSHLTFSCISLCHTFSYAQDGCTPLYVACQNGHKQTVGVLLKNGANANLTCTVSYIVVINQPFVHMDSEGYCTMSVACVCISPSLSYPTMCNTGATSDACVHSPIMSPPLLTDISKWCKV